MNPIRIDALACDVALRARIASHLDGFAARRQDFTAARQAAVAITIVNTGPDPGGPGITVTPRAADSAALVLTRRAASLKHHSGQWAFPGGRKDSGETAEETALRELAEEVGLVLGPERVIGRLDDFSTRSGFVITPVVIWGGTGVGFQRNPGEVRSIHRIPIAEFLRDDSPILEDIPESPNPVLLMPVGDAWIAAPTAALIYQFREVAILGRHTRVAHFEQPVFAWK